MLGPDGLPFNQEGFYPDPYATEELCKEAIVKKRPDIDNHIKMVNEEGVVHIVGKILACKQGL